MIKISKRLQEKKEKQGAFPQSQSDPWIRMDLSKKTRKPIQTSSLELFAEIISPHQSKVMAINNRIGELEESQDHTVENINVLNDIVTMFQDGHDPNISDDQFVDVGACLEDGHFMDVIEIKNEIKEEVDAWGEYGEDINLTCESTCEDEDLVLLDGVELNLHVISEDAYTPQYLEDYVMESDPENYDDVVAAVVQSLESEVSGAGRGQYSGQMKSSKLLSYESGEQTFPCANCSKVFSRLNALKQHETNHCGELKFACTECDRMFSKASSLRSHMLRHEAEPSYTRTSNDLTKVKKQQSRSDGVERLYICSECDKSFTSAYKLKSHEFVHRDETPYACKECDKTFKWPSSLRVHKATHQGDRPYACFECDSTFTQPSSLKVHVQLHRGGRPFACEECGKTFKLASTLRGHRSVHRKERPFMCSDCGKKFSRASHLSYHQRVHRDRAVSNGLSPGDADGDKKDLISIFNEEGVLMGIIKQEEDDLAHKLLEMADLKNIMPKIRKQEHLCSICSAKFPSRVRLLRHEEMHNEIKAFICQLPECLLSFATAAELRRHEMNHPGPYLCTQCGQTFSAQSCLRRHESTHTDRPFACTMCDQRFALSGNLKRHETTHTGDRPYECAECEKKFSQPSHVKVHIKRMHSVERPYKCKLCRDKFMTAADLAVHESYHRDDDQFLCTHCFKNFSSAATLKVHIVSIHDGMRIACSYCDRYFVSAAALRVHEAVHRGEKMFVCHECDKSFSTAASLKVHTNTIHRGERIYSCPGCEKKFCTGSALTVHYRGIHRREKPHKCTQCLKSFSTASNLKVHEAIHSDERPFACGQCDKTFKLASILKGHEQMHRGEKLYACDVCERRFFRLSQLEHHKRSHADNEEDEVGFVEFFIPEDEQDVEDISEQKPEADTKQEN